MPERGGQQQEKAEKKDGEREDETQNGAEDFQVSHGGGGSLDELPIDIPPHKNQTSQQADALNAMADFFEPAHEKGNSRRAAIPCLRSEWVYPAFGSLQHPGEPLSRPHLPHFSAPGLQQRSDPLTCPHLPQRDFPLSSLEAQGAFFAAPQAMGPQAANELTATVIAAATRRLNHTFFMSEPFCLVVLYMIARYFILDNLPKNPDNMLCQMEWAKDNPLEIQTICQIGG